MDRPVEELLKLKSYDGLTHNEVMALIKHYEFLAKDAAFTEYTKSGVFVMTTEVKEQQKALYEKALNLIESCRINFRDVTKYEQKESV